MNDIWADNLPALVAEGGMGKQEVVYDETLFSKINAHGK
jgi:hypothetical protein